MTPGNGNEKLAAPRQSGRSSPDNRGSSRLPPPPAVFAGLEKRGRRAHGVSCGGVAGAIMSNMSAERARRRSERHQLGTEVLCSIDTVITGIVAACASPRETATVSR